MVDNIEDDLSAIENIPKSSYEFQKRYISRRVEVFKQGDEQLYWNSLMSGIPTGVREEYFDHQLKKKNLLLANKIERYLMGFQHHLPLILYHMSSLLGEYGIGNFLLHKSWEIIWDQ